MGVLDAHLWGRAQRSHSAGRVRGATAPCRREFIVAIAGGEYERNAAREELLGDRIDVSIGQTDIEDDGVEGSSSTNCNTVLT